jgi:hypothetical protein
MLDASRPPTSHFLLSHVAVEETSLDRHRVPTAMPMNFSVADASLDEALKRAFRGGPNYMQGAAREGAGEARRPATLQAAATAARSRTQSSVPSRSWLVSAAAGRTGTSARRI